MPPVTRRRSAAGLPNNNGGVTSGGVQARAKGGPTRRVSMGKNKAKAVAEARKKAM